MRSLGIDPDDPAVDARADSLDPGLDAAAQVRVTHFLALAEFPERLYQLSEISLFSDGGAVRDDGQGRQRVLPREEAAPRQPPVPGEARLHPHGREVVVVV